MTETILRLLVSGRVQGVGYRDFVRSEAEARGLTGWVRNRRDGAVEAVVRGARESVDELIAACWRGPPASRVADVQVECLEAADPDLPAVGFAIRPTA
jgi:acylphosphatase